MGASYISACVMTDCSFVCRIVELQLWDSCTGESGQGSQDEADSKASANKMQRCRAQTRQFAECVNQFQYYQDILQSVRKDQEQEQEFNALRAEARQKKRKRRKRKKKRTDEK